MSAQLEYIDVKQNSMEWLVARQGSLGASDSAVILGLSNWSAPIDIKHSKTMPVEQEENEEMHRGHILEPLVISAYCLKHGCIHDEGRMTRNKSYPWLHATPDATVPKKTMTTYSRIKLLEIKTANMFTLAKDAANRDSYEYGEEGTDQIPDYVMVQVQQQMLVTEQENATVFVLFSNTEAFKLLVKLVESGADNRMLARIILEMETREYHIERDDEICALIVKETHDWWQKYIVEDQDPPDLPRMQDDGKICVCPEASKKEIAIAKKHWMALERAKDRLEKKRDKIKLLIGEHSGIADGDAKITWKKNKTGVKVDWQGIVTELRESAKDNDESDVIEKVIADNTIPKEGSRTFRWPSKWKKEM